MSESILSAADSRAKTSALPEAARDCPESGLASGQSIAESFASFDPMSSSWRTSQLSLFGGLTLFSETWPASGSMRNGRVYRRAPWVRHMCDSDCSLWPTPTASMDGRGFGIALHEDSDRYKKSTVLRIQELVRSHGWRIHPNFTEALMGFPIDHSAIEVSATQSSQTLQSGSDAA